MYLGLKCRVRNRMYLSYKPGSDTYVYVIHHDRGSLLGLLERPGTEVHPDPTLCLLWHCFWHHSDGLLSARFPLHYLLPFMLENKRSFSRTTVGSWHLSLSGLRQIASLNYMAHMRQQDEVGDRESGSLAERSPYLILIYNKHIRAGPTSLQYIIAKPLLFLTYW